MFRGILTIEVLFFYFLSRVDIQYKIRCQSLAVQDIEWVVCDGVCTYLLDYGLN